MQSFQLIHVSFLCWPADNETLFIGGARLRNNVEVNMVDFLVCDATIVLYSEVFGERSKRNHLTRSGVLMGG